VTVIRVGMVGGGFMARTYSFALGAVRGLGGLEVPDVERVRVADIAPGAAERIARDWGWRDHGTDWRLVTRAEDVDLVLVLTPNDSHALIAGDAFDHGKHVLCEKPLADTPEAAEAMCRAAVASGLVHQVGFNYRKWPAAAFARDLIEAGEIGEIVHYRGRFLHDYGLDPDMPITWRLQRARSGGGSGADIGSHVIDMARYLVGEIDGVFARSRTHFGHRPVAGRPGETAPVDVDEITDMLVEFESGITGSLQTSWLAGGHKMDIAFAVHGTKGSVEYSSEQPTEIRLYRATDPAPRSGFAAVPIGPVHPGGELFWPVAGMAIGFGEAFVIAVRDVLRSIAAGTAASPSFLDGLRASEVVAAAQRSAEGRTWEPVHRTAMGEPANHR
jgi:predicted dehydrogenase